MLEIVVHEIRGYCPVYKVGDKMVIDDPEIVLEKTDALCTHALSTQTLEKFNQNASQLHYALILEYDWCPVKLGLTTAEDEEHAYMQCVDPGKPYTEGGTVIFKCSHLYGTTRLHEINTEEKKKRKIQKGIKMNNLVK